MPLPVPDIMQNAATVLKAAKEMGYKPTEEQIKSLHHLTNMVSADDLLAVLNEVGRVYVGMHNIQIARIASAPDLQNKKFAFIIEIVPTGLDPIVLTIPLTVEQGRFLIKSFQDTLTALTVSEGKLILDAGNA